MEGEKILIPPRGGMKSKNFLKSLKMNEISSRSSNRMNNPDASELTLSSTILSTLKEVINRGTSSFRVLNT